MLNFDVDIGVCVNQYHVEHLIYNRVIKYFFWFFKFDKSSWL